MVKKKKKKKKEEEEEKDPFQFSVSSKEHVILQHIYNLTIIIIIIIIC
jgi:hypothetical protein